MKAGRITHGILSTAVECIPNLPDLEKIGGWPGDFALERIQRGMEHTKTSRYRVLASYMTQGSAETGQCTDSRPLSITGLRPTSVTTEVTTFLRQGTLSPHLGDACADTDSTSLLKHCSQADLYFAKEITLDVNSTLPIPIAGFPVRDWETMAPRVRVALGVLGHRYIIDTRSTRAEYLFSRDRARSATKLVPAVLVVLVVLSLEAPGAVAIAPRESLSPEHRAAVASLTSCYHAFLAHLVSDSRELA